jgi:hypothetical protein
MAFEIDFGIFRLVKIHTVVFLFMTPYNLVVCFSIFHCQGTSKQEQGIAGTRKRPTRCDDTEHYNVKVQTIILHNC